MSDSIELYKPNPSVEKAFELDEKLPEIEYTFDLFKKLVLARKTQDFVFLTIGKMLKIVRDRKLYRHLDFEDFSQFLASEEISFSREKAYLYIRIYELYIEKLMVNPEEVEKLGVARLMMLAPVIRDLPREQAIKKIEESRPLRYGDFVRQVKQDTNKDGKPTVYFSQERKKWIVNYFQNITELLSLGNFEGEVKNVETGQPSSNSDVK